MRRISRAWISMSDAMPCAPPDGWWTMIRLLVSAMRIPGSPAASRKLPIDAAWPMHTVPILGRIYCIVSWIARPGRDHAARRVDVHEDVLLRVLGLEEEQLGGDQRGHMVLDRAGDEDDPLAQQPRVNVEAALAAVRLLDDDRNEAGDDVLMVHKNARSFVVWRSPTSGGTRACSSHAGKERAAEQVPPPLAFATCAAITS